MPEVAHWIFPEVHGGGVDTNADPTEEDCIFVIVDTVQLLVPLNCDVL